MGVLYEYSGEGMGKETERGHQSQVAGNKKVEGYVRECLVWGYDEDRE